nr:hypothetical protein [Bacteroidota bacterium]
MGKKSFKDTKVGNFLSKVAPDILDVVDDVFPPAKLLTKLLEGADITPEQRTEFDLLNREYDLKEYQAHVEDRKRASEMYIVKNKMADFVARNVMKWNLPLVAFLVLVNVACIIWLDKVLLAVIANVIGMIINSLLNERLTIMNFFYGSSEIGEGRSKIDI